MLAVYDKQVLDIDRVLSYSSRYMKNLKHVRISLSEYHNTINISTDILRSFLKSNVGQLDSFTFDWMRDTSTYTDLITFSPVYITLTNGGEIWTELHGLKVLEITHPIFDNCKGLVKA